VKPQTEKKQELRVNHRIRIPKVRVIGPDGAQLGVMDTIDALRIANDQYDSDLIEIAPFEKPPVCKIMDYGKYKYQQKKKSQEAKKNQTIILVKEIKFRPNTDQHDFDVKVRHIARFLSEGNKAKVTIRFRGRELTHAEIGRGVLSRVVSNLGDVVVVEQEPKLEGRQMTMVLAPK
jgi:translation initiation factor IF-3